MSPRLLQRIFTIFLLGVFIAPLGLNRQSDPRLPAVDVKTAVTKVGQLKQSIVPSVSHYEPADIKDELERHRNRIGLEPFIFDNQICNTGQEIFNTQSDLTSLTSQDLEPFCPTCSQTASYAVAGNYRIEGQEPWMNDPKVQQLISQNYTHLCIYAESKKALLLMGTVAGQARSNTAPSAKVVAENMPITNFTENELWQAFVDYRHAHAKPDLLREESLCRYARERVQEHLRMFETVPQSEYTNQDKYPLDAHAGFMRDGDSGYLFEVTGFNVVAENLAYWPSAQYPHQVIEWGWDTSTEGHREAQLSTEYSHACLSGQNGFYVSIFARN